MSLDRKEQFAELARTQGPRLRRLAGGYARGDEAADLLQEMLLQIWRSLPRFRGDAAVETWGYRIALNTGISHLRREIRRRSVVEAAHAKAALDEVAGDRSSEAEQARILDAFLASLGSVDRSVMLGYLEGLSHEETAAAVGCSAGAVATRINRLKTAFKARYLGE